MSTKFSRLEGWIEGTSRHPRLWLALFALLMGAQISPWLYPTVDGCLYMKTARDFLAAPSLSEFHCLVPPGYPALITPAFLFGNRPFLEIALLQWLLSLVMMGGVYVWARRQFPTVAVLLTGAVMVNISLWAYYRRPTKEIATLALLMWTVNLMHRLLDERRIGRIVALTAIAAVLTAYASLMRYTIVTLTVGFGLAAVWLAWQRAFGWSRAVTMSGVVGLVTAVTLASWLYYDRTYGAGGIYLQEVMSVYSHQPSRTDPKTRRAGTELGSESDGGTQSVAIADDDAQSHGRAARFLQGMVYRINDVGCLCVPGLWKSSIEPWRLPGASMLAFLGLSGVLVVGWWKIVRCRLDVLALTLPAYFLLYSHWVCDQPGGRFMLPMLPILVACGWFGLATLARQRATLVFGLLIAAHFVQASGYWLVVDAPRAYQNHRNWSLIDRLAGQIRERYGEVALATSVDQTCHGLWLELDWSHPLRNLEMQFGPRVVWIVEPAGSQPHKGFRIRRVDGPVQLASRELEQHPAHASAPPRIAPKPSDATVVAGNP
ncbi:MAG TPA: glycosyltransferase family 39 protein [Planctomycetaceae bacterium]|nr:glycosyltransferase family 39 protein [Planctomycetaceae bacterium]